ncbi:hypothetical protein [Avibacterium sp. 20-129]|uniref:hypothetical protein n=1 Tax=Avibacterium sp. 20-129 TaxID=2911525 RepID=UPI002245F21F|nr:hypothetical protein [Avibacterium sp. 20-129]MCW9698144.1 hypothetical protein [Avibacterium sp. 20-129]
MMNEFPIYTKQWFSLNALQRFIKQQFNAELSAKNILATLAQHSEIAILFNANYQRGTQPLLLGSNTYPTEHFQLKAPPIWGFEEITKQTILTTLKQKEAIQLKAERTELSLQQIDGKPQITALHGLLYVPPFSLTEEALAFSDENTLLLPEYSFYELFEGVEWTYNDNVITHHPEFLYLAFSDPTVEHTLAMADLRFYLDDPAQLTGIFSAINSELGKNQPAAEFNAAELIKNKSNENANNGTEEKIKNKKDFYNKAIFNAIKRTAEANPECGGYQIINAVIAEMKARYNLKENADFHSIRYYLDKAKKELKLSFPNNRGNRKSEIHVILNAK